MWNVIAFTLLCLVSATSSYAQNRHVVEYPTRAVRLLVPFSAGGSADNYARVVAQKLSDHWAQQVVVDNRPGSNGIVGSEVFVKATADGYTLMLGNIGNIAVNPSMYNKLPYDPIKDFAPITLINTSPFVMLSPLSLPAQDFKEFVSLAKSRPGHFNYASTGDGSPGHLAAALLASMSGIKITHIPYRNHGTLMSDIVSGQTHILFNGIASAQQQLKVKRLQALAISSPKRSTVLPNVPTVAESGIAGYEFLGWYALFSPSGTPTKILHQLNVDINKVLSSQDVRERFSTDGAEVAGGSRESLGKFVLAEIQKWEPIVKGAVSKH